jgi:hypothetical protein
MREVQIVVHDDIDGTELPPNSDPYQFSLSGDHYEIDLTDEHIRMLRDSLRPFLDAARPVPPSKINSGSDAPSYERRWLKTASDHRQRRDDLQRVRKWAARQGYQVAARARIPIKVHVAYNEAHPHDRIEIAPIQHKGRGGN